MGLTLYIAGSEQAPNMVVVLLKQHVSKDLIFWNW